MPTQERLRELLAEEILKTPKNASYAMLSSHDAFESAALAAMSRAVQEAYEEAAKEVREFRSEYVDAAEALYAAIVDARLPLANEKYKALNLALNIFYIQSDRRGRAEMPETNDC